ncbi:MAG: hypothetical protein MI717_05175 [Spirochaetales bacterium]|nr:hypothetical protein [Spirochaetales bacterium]
MLEKNSPRDAIPNSPTPPSNGGVDKESETPTATQEASPYLLDFRLGDADVDVFWDGYWRLGFVTGGSFGKKTAENQFNGLNRGTAFTQEPDLTFSLWLANQWFVEATFLEGFDRNTYRAGYVGTPGSVVEEVVVGNAGIGATSYAGIDVSTPQYNAPGLSAVFSTPKSRHEALIRFDATSPQEKIFEGAYEVRVEELALSDFLEGRAFILPDSGDGIENAVVYFEDSQGSLTGTDGLSGTRPYRRGEDGEYFLDEENGLLTLSESATGRVLMFYEVNGTDVGAASLGRNFVVPANASLQPDFEAWGGQDSNLIDFDWNEVDVYDPAGRDYSVTSQVTIEGNSALILYEPGRFTPFERQNLYASSRPLPEETWRISPRLEQRGSLYPASESPEYSFASDTEDQTLTVFGATGSDSRHPGNRYPFAAADPQAYGPGRAEETAFSRTIQLAIRESNASYSLGTGVVPGSVIVLVNGVRDYSVQVTNDGRLEFQRFIYADDWIEVSYRTETLDLDGGDIYVYQGNQFQLTPRLTWELAESLRWNLGTKRTSEEFGTSPGEITVASTLDWQADSAGVTVTTEGILSTPDTGGNLRLFGMDSGGYSLALFDQALVETPSSPLSSLPPNRVSSSQFDYITYDSFGRPILRDYSYTGATATGEDKAGLASGRSGDPTSRVMDLRFALDDDDWSAADALADSRSLPNLSASTALEIPIAFLKDWGENTDGNRPQVYLEIGEIGESADHHNDGGIQPKDLGRSLSWELSALSFTASQINDAWANPGTWKTLRIPLTSAERVRLSSVRSYRLIVANTSGSEVSGRLLAGPPRFDGSAFRTEVRNASDGLTSNQDVSADEVEANSLKSAFPETDELFHDKNEENRALRIRWGTETGGSALGAATRWEASSWFSPVPAQAYRSLRFYLKDDDGVGPLSLEISDDQGKGYVLSWDSSAPTGWQRITLDLSTQRATSSSGQGITVTADSNIDQLSRIVLRGSTPDGSTVGIRSGSILLDEIHLRDPSYTLTGNGEVEGFWRYQDDLWSLGSVPMLGNIEVKGRLRGAGGQVVSSQDQGNYAAGGDVSLKTDLLGLGVQTHWSGTWTKNNQQWSGSHTLRIPARFNTFWITDSHSLGTGGDDGHFSRENTMNLTLSPGSISVYGRALTQRNQLIQSWGGTTRWRGNWWDVSAETDYILSTDQYKSEQNYFSSWIHGFTLLAPSQTSTLNREAHHELVLAGHWGPVTVKWDPTLRMKTSQSPLWVQENYWAGTLSLPLQFSEWSLIPAYRRSLRQKVDPGAQNQDYLDSWNVFARNLAPLFPLSHFVPFGELFGQADSAVFTQGSQQSMEADYEAEFSLDLSRSAQGRWQDLLLPSSGGLSMEREYQRKGATVGWKDEWRATLAFSAINLFGAFGLYPFIPFYNTEELSSLYQLILKDRNGNTPSPSEFSWQANASFRANRDARLTLDHRLLWDWNEKRRRTIQEGRIDFDWQTASREVLRLPFIKRAIPRSHRLENTERLQITATYPWQDAPSDQNFDMGFILHHESRWVFDDLGHFKGWLALGLGGNDNGFTNAWELGMEIEVRF